MNTTRDVVLPTEEYWIVWVVGLSGHGFLKFLNSRQVAEEHKRAAEAYPFRSVTLYHVREGLHVA